MLCLLRKGGYYMEWWKLLLIANSIGVAFLIYFIYSVANEILVIRQHLNHDD
jgi:hypothetical protein